MKELAETEATYLVDAGDALFKYPYIADDEGEHLKEVATAIISAYNVMDCRVLNIGTNDLAAGLDFILEMEKMANFPFISANTKDASTDKFLFKPYFILETHDQKLGFVGITKGDNRVKEFVFSDPVEAAQKSIDEIKDKVDLVFLMANGDDKLEKQLTAEVTDIDFLIRSKTGSLQRNPRQEDGTTIIRIGKQGKYAGVLRIRNVDNVSQMKNVSSQYTRIKFSDNRLKAMTKGLEDGVTLEEHYADDENRLKLITRLRDERKTNVDLIKKLKNSYYLEPIALNEKIEDSPEVAAVVKDYMPEENDEAKKADPKKK
jgi:2',3'-cyclic-nucleotide 2'-phosphodiesterase (5'-nucleotidase family)